MANDGAWIDITVVGDNYQVEMSADGKQYRHRPFSIGGVSSSRDRNGIGGGSPPMGRAWRPGLPPSGTNAQRKEE